MTLRQYYQTVLDAHIDEDMDKASTELINKLDERNEKRKSADSKEKRETAERRAIVLKYLQDNEGQYTRDDIANATGLTPGQVSSACSALGESIKKSEVKVDKAKRTVYEIA